MPRSLVHACCFLLVVAVGCGSPPTQPPKEPGEVQIPEATNAPEPAPAAVAAPPEPGPAVFGQLVRPFRPPTDAERTDSGLSFVVIRAGHGDRPPGPEDGITMHYVGWDRTGEKFDSSLDREKPMDASPKHLIEGFAEALSLMVEGERRRVWIPAELAYGHAPKGGQMASSRPFGDLIFDIELLAIDRREMPETPADVAAPPPRATVTASGLAYEVLERGTGATRPKPDDVVTIHYSGWTTDGAMFDSSVTRGKPASFAPQNTIAGFSEGLQLMAEGDRYILWIPEDLAYQGKPGRPAGMLVFEIEMLDVP